MEPIDITNPDAGEIAIDFKQLREKINNVSAVKVGEGANPTQHILSTQMETPDIFRRRANKSEKALTAESFVELYRAEILSKIDPTKRTAVIDPGHGRGMGGALYEPGAVSKATGLSELELINEVTPKIIAGLKEKGCNVIDLGPYVHGQLFTKSGESLKARADITRVIYENSASGSCFISVHANSGGPNATGFEILRSDHHADSKILAESIASEFKKADTKLDFRSCYDRASKGKGVHVVNANENSVLLELGFVTNKSDVAKVRKINWGQIVSDGVDKFFQLQNQLTQQQEKAPENKVDPKVSQISADAINKYISAQNPNLETAELPPKPNELAIKMDKANGASLT